MSKALSVDLRERVVAAVAAGASCRAAAARFGVSASSAIRWRALSREAGSVAPGPLGGDHHSSPIEAHAALILDFLAQKSGTTLAEIRAEFARAGVAAGITTIWRLFQRHRITRKKRTARAAIPHGHWKTTTFIAGLRNSGMVAPMAFDGPINGAAFQA